MTDFAAARPSPAEPPAGDLEQLHHSPRCPAEWRCRFAVKGQPNYDGSGYHSQAERESDRAAHYEIYSGTAAELRAALRDPAPLAVGDREPLPVGAYVASALADANIPCDSGEDVDRFLEQLAWRGYEVALKAETPEPSALDVDVLARAIKARMDIAPFRSSRTSFAGIDALDYADAIAAEYARLQAAAVR